MTIPIGMDEHSLVRGTELRLDSLIDGLTSKVPASITSILVNGVSMPVADVVKKAQDLDKPWKTAREAHAVIRALSKTRDRDEEDAKKFLGDVRVGLVAALGRESERLVDFGFKPERPRHDLTPEEKVRRAEKAKLTRELRHTMGARQKASLKADTAPPHAPGADSAGPAVPPHVS